MIKRIRVNETKVAKTELILLARKKINHNKGNYGLFCFRLYSQGFFLPCFCDVPFVLCLPTHSITYEDHKILDGDMQELGDILTNLFHRHSK